MLWNRPKADWNELGKKTQKIPAHKAGDFCGFLLVKETGGKYPARVISRESIGGGKAGESAQNQRHP
ncbi:hypothetical protein [Hymenobacter fastidiosus]|uniref:hypothetical protein n=1 Tax=Hymenobacter fastidiosus TaxID=486264 RepID=UPI0031F109E6